jgi:hypothetical protein
MWVGCTPGANEITKTPRRDQLFGVSIFVEAALVGHAKDEAFARIHALAWGWGRAENLHQVRVGPKRGRIRWCVPRAHAR